jgi:hypothetical protein
MANPVGEKYENANKLNDPCLSFAFVACFLRVAYLVARDFSQASTSLSL